MNDNNQKLNSGCFVIIGVIIFICSALFYGNIKNVTRQDKVLQREGLSKKQVNSYYIGNDVFVEPIITKTSNEFEVKDVFRNTKFHIKIVGLNNNYVFMEKGVTYFVKIHSKRYDDTYDDFYYVIPYTK